MFDWDSTESGTQGKKKDAAPPDAPPVDAAPPDAVPLPDADLRPDAAPPDADPCGCVASGECQVSHCVGGECVEAPATDGTPCSGGVCLAGACAAPSCGDGYRQPGPSPAREACDDGNVADGDACSATCTPTLFVIAARAEGADEANGGAQPVAADDGVDQVLVVWKQMAASSHDVVARRYTRAGVPVGDVVTIASGLLAESEPSVAGFAGGWAVVWRSPSIDGDSFGIGLALVDGAGAVGSTTHANQTVAGTQLEPSVARLGDGFVVAWTHRSGMSSTVRARRFGATGAPLDAADLIVSSVGADGETPSVAAGDGAFLVTWASTVDLEDPVIVGRRYSGSSPIDAAPFPVSTTGWSFLPAATRLDSGDYAVAWGSFTSTMTRDVWARRVPATGDPSSASTVEISADAALSERLPSLAPLPPDGYAVLAHVYGSEADASESEDMLLVAVDGALAPEASDVSTLFSAAGLQGHGAVARVGDGLWLTWESEGVVATPYPALVGFTLATP